MSDHAQQFRLLHAVGGAGALQLAFQPAEPDEVMVEVEEAFTADAEESIALVPQVRGLFAQARHFGRLMKTREPGQGVVDGHIRMQARARLFDPRLQPGLLPHTKLDVFIQGRLLHVFAPQPVVLHLERGHFGACLTDQAVVAVDAPLLRNGHARLLSQVVLQLENSLGHQGRGLGAEPGARVLGDCVLDGALRRPQKPLPEPLVEMVVCSAGMSDVADAIAHGLVEEPMIVARPGEEGQAVVNHGQRRVGPTLIEKVVPLGWPVAVEIGSGVGLNVTIL